MLLSISSLFNINEETQEGQPIKQSGKEEPVQSIANEATKDLFDGVIRNNSELRQFFLDNVIYGEINGSFLGAIEDNVISHNRFFLECHYARRGELEGTLNDDLTTLERLCYQALGQMYPYAKKQINQPEQN